MTYGSLKLRLTQLFPSVGIEIIEGLINDRYQEILVELPWTRQTVEGVLQTTAPYSTGTVAVVQGSSSVTLTGGSFTASMTGRAFRVTGDAEFYAFTFVSASTGSLDRPYEGINNPAAPFSIFQFIYPLPSNCRMLDDNAFAPLRRYDHAELQAMDPWRQWTWSGSTGGDNPGPPETWTPQHPGTCPTPGWAVYMDDSSVPPRMQVELYPIPDSVVGLPYRYVASADDLTSTSTILQVWMQPAALFECVAGRICAHLKDFNGAQFHTALGEAALKKMRASEAQGMAPASMRLSDYYTRHRDYRGRW